MVTQSSQAPAPRSSSSAPPWPPLFVEQLYMWVDERGNQCASGQGTAHFIGVTREGDVYLVRSSKLAPSVWLKFSPGAAAELAMLLTDGACRGEQLQRRGRARGILSKLTGPAETGPYPGDSPTIP